MMQEQHAQPSEVQPSVAQTPPQDATTAATRPWERPTLERLSVSLDTTTAGGSGADGGGKSKFV